MNKLEKFEWISPLEVVRAIGPSVAPFFKTFVIYMTIIPLNKNEISAFKTMMKCLPISCLICFTISHGIIHKSDAVNYRRLVTLGLIFGVIGDYLMVYSHEISCFIGGITSFAIGHLFYYKAFENFSWNVFKNDFPKLFMAGSITFLMFINMSLLLALFSFIYGALLLNNLLSSYRKMCKNKSKWHWNDMSACLGCFLFLISDTVLGLFIADHIVHINIPYIIMTTYYLSQFFIAVSTFDNKILTQSIISREKIM